MKLVSRLTTAGSDDVCAIGSERPPFQSKFVFVIGQWRRFGCRTPSFLSRLSRAAAGAELPREQESRSPGQAARTARWVSPFELLRVPRPPLSRPSCAREGRPPAPPAPDQQARPDGVQLGAVRPAR